MPASQLRVLRFSLLLVEISIDGLLGASEQRAGRAINTFTIYSAVSRLRILSAVEALNLPSLLCSIARLTTIDMPRRQLDLLFTVRDLLLCLRDEGFSLSHPVCRGLKKKL